MARAETTERLAGAKPGHLHALRRGSGLAQARGAEVRAAVMPDPTLLPEVLEMFQQCIDRLPDIIPVKPEQIDGIHAQRAAAGIDVRAKLGSCAPS